MVLLFLVFLPALSGISGNLEQKTILPTTKQLIQYTVLEIKFWSLKYRTVVKIRKTLSKFPTVLSHFRQFSNTSDCINLLKLYATSVIILLGNVLVNICSEISKIWLILWMVYTCSVKRWRKLKSLVEMNVLCIVEKDHQWWVIAVDHTSKFKVI